jgi:predicted lipoprotein
MNKKLIRYIIFVTVAGLLLYNSVYFKKLDAKTEAVQTDLDPGAFAQKFWANFAAAADSAVEINSFVQQLKADATATVAKYAKSQGIGNTVYVLVKGEGFISAINEDDVLLLVKSGTQEIKIKINTGIYFGNAVRDVTGKIKMGDFTNTMDYNNVSVELNKIVRSKIVMPFKATAKKGQLVQFAGCIELNTEKINADNIMVLPVKIIAQ